MDRIELKSKYEEQCRELNMDRDTEEKAWKRYTEIAQRFILEGDQSHWFSCTLYASCRESVTPTVGDAVVMGNCVSLTKLLRCCNISIYEFISKIKRWYEMANLPEEFRKQIEILERNFSITFFLNTPYKKIFHQLFAYSSNDKKNPKFRSVSKCSFDKLYELCWYLFLCVKNESQDNLDLVTSFHILICCMDIVYLNVIAENRVDLVNQNFAGYPKKLISAGLNAENVEWIEDTCVIEKLCELADVMPEEAKRIKNGTWKTIMEGFFDSNTLYGDRATFLGVISNQNFERNLKSLNASYEQYILSVGTFDERLLLNNQNHCHANTPENGNVYNDIEHNDKRHQIITMSPDISPYATKRGGSSIAIVEAADTCTEKVRKLLEMTQHLQPSEYLKSAGEPVLKKISEKLASMSQHLASCLTNTPDCENHLKLITSLYYNLLEKIIRIEVNNKPHINLQILLDTESFHTTLIICCAEIVLNSYNLETKFPWILNRFNVDAFNFYRIIELVVGRHESILGRSHIKHLNSIEESCLEHLAWRSSSALWDIIKQNSSQPLPAWIDVDANSRRMGSIQLIQQHTNSPINSAYDTFSAAVVPTSDTARKDLFNTGREVAKQLTTESSKGTKTIERLGSLNIFFRKFYKLAWLRIKELCKELNMDSEACLKKIWTLFEHSIMQSTDLLRDRHLDQIIMCAIYIFIKVTEHENNTFTDIMKAYRKQPQAVSSIYREVLIESSGDDNEKKPLFADLIYFYNNIYVQKMTKYAMSFSKNKPKDTDLLLSPHPTERQNAPKKISSNHKIFVSPMEKYDIRNSPDSLIYGIGTSPAKDLQRMNDVVKRGKRNLPFNEESPIHCKEARLAPAYLTTIQGILNDRHSERS